MTVLARKAESIAAELCELTAQYDKDRKSDKKRKEIRDEIVSRALAYGKVDDWSDLAESGYTLGYRVEYYITIYKDGDTEIRIAGECRRGPGPTSIGLYLRTRDGAGADWKEVEITDVTRQRLAEFAARII